jgi:hypothetical protein
MGGVTLAAALALSASLALPRVAHAGPLLSGYGGPGQGNQAILGSALLGGSKGGGGSGSRGAGKKGPHAGASALQASGTPGATGTAAVPQGGSVASAGRTAGSYPTVEPASSRSGSAFGLSDADLAYILLAAAVLAVTGALTRRIARSRIAKGHG